MYNDYYGMKYNPFSKETVDDSGYFESGDHKEMLSRLNYLKDIRGIGIFTARPGMGKTCSLRCFMREINRNMYTPVYICLSTVSISDFYSSICDALGLTTSFHKSTMFKEIQERVYYLYKDRKQPLILAIDEAQHLHGSILCDLKMIMNQNYDSVNCFSLILVGEPYLNSIIERPVHEALKQRITVHYNFTGLTEKEGPEYIFHKIEKAGGDRRIINEAALSAVTSYSQGNARLIDNVMTTALTLGAQNNKAVIDADVILSAVNEQALDTE